MFVDTESAPSELQGMRERFKRQQVDDPVDQLGSCRTTPAHS